MSKPRYEIQTGSGKSAYVTVATSTRLAEAYARYAGVDVLGTDRKRLLRNGKVLVRQQGDDRQQRLDFSEEAS